MSARTITHIGVYAAIAAVFVWLMAQFFYGDLGIIETREKQRAIAELKMSIAELKRSAGEKYAALEKLTRDTEAIRAYALLYGMVGGADESAALRTTPAGSEPEPAQVPAANARLAPPPFFLRHPILIALAGAIVLVGGGLLVQRRKARQRQGAHAAEYAHADGFFIHGR